MTEIMTHEQRERLRAAIDHMEKIFSLLSNIEIPFWLEGNDQEEKINLLYPLQAAIEQVNSEFRTLFSNAKVRLKNSIHQQYKFGHPFDKMFIRFERILDCSEGATIFCLLVELRKLFRFIQLNYLDDLIVEQLTIMQDLVADIRQAVRDMITSCEESLESLKA